MSSCRGINVTWLVLFSPIFSTAYEFVKTIVMYSVMPILWHRHQKVCLAPVHSSRRSLRIILKMNFTACFINFVSAAFAVPSFATRPSNTHYTIGDQTLPSFTCEINFDSNDDSVEWYAYLTDDLPVLIASGLKVDDDYVSEYFITRSASAGGSDLKLRTISLTSTTKFECRNKLSPVISAAASVIVYGKQRVCYM